MASKKTVKKATKKAAKKVAPKSTSKAPAPKPNKRGPVLIEKSIKEIVKFIGSDDIPIMVSKRSLIEAKTKGVAAAAAKELELEDESDLA